MDVLLSLIIKTAKLAEPKVTGMGNKHFVQGHVVKCGRHNPHFHSFGYWRGKSAPCISQRFRAFTSSCRTTPQLHTSIRHDPPAGNVTEVSIVMPLFSEVSTDGFWVMGCKVRLVNPMGVRLLAHKVILAEAMLHGKFI